MNSSTLNRVTLIGYVGETPKIIYVKPEGLAVCNFRIATHKNYKNRKGESVEETIWHKLAAWQHLAEYVSENVKKGMKVYVEGEISTSSYTAAGGYRKDIVTIIVNEIKVF